MANTKEFFTRIQHKHDIEENWLKATNFTPLDGEIIIYDPDTTYNYSRTKIGDGVTKINDLPFNIDENIADLGVITIDIEDSKNGIASNVNADTFNGYLINHFVTKPEAENMMLKTGGHFSGTVTIDNTANIKYQINDDNFVLVGHSNGEFVISSNVNGSWKELIRLNTDGSIKGGLLMPKTGGNFSGTVKFNSAPTIYQTTSIANNYPAQLNFVVKQTDNNIETSASIAVYDDHDEGTYGTNMVIQSKGNMIIGSGESPNGYYQNNLLDNASEKTYIVSDNNINFVVNANTLANAKTATINTDGGATFAGNVIVGNANSTTDRTRNIECWNAGKTARVSTNKIVMVRK